MVASDKEQIEESETTSYASHCFQVGDTKVVTISEAW